MESSIHTLQYSEDVEKEESKLKQSIRRVAAVFSVAMILFVYSEELFWAVPRHTDNISNFAFTYAIYLMPTFFVLYLSDKFNVRDIWALFLVGTIYGWIVEGIIVNTMYEAIPFSISFTGMAWHSLISVIFGFYLFQKAINTNDRKLIIILSIITGVFWGFWAVNWYAELGYLPNILLFCVFTTSFTILLVTGLLGYNCLRIHEFKPSKLEKLIFFGVFSFFYLFDVLFSEVSIYVLFLWTPLVLVTLYILKLSKKYKVGNDSSVTKIESSNSILNSPNNRLSSIIFVSKTANLKLAFYVLLVAPIASLVYAMEVTTGFLFSSTVLLYVTTTFLGFAFYIKAVLNVRSGARGL